MEGGKYLHDGKYSNFFIRSMGHAVAQLVKALRYMPEGRGFDS
jgi:hypothetical protein